MFETLRNAFKIKDLRHRIIFTFLMLIVVRLGSQLPVPGVDPEVLPKTLLSLLRRSEFILHPALSLTDKGHRLDGIQFQGPFCRCRARCESCPL